MRRLSATFALWAAVSSPAAAENLLVNPGFDVPDQLTGWTCTATYGTPTWSPIDHLASPDSGSMQHDVTAASDNRNVRCMQCVAVDEFITYLGSVWFYWPDDPDVLQQGTTRMSFNFFSDPNCTVDTGVFEVAIALPTLDTWLELRTEAREAPAGAVSAAVYVFTWQNFANQPVRARLDDLSFRTVAIFQDGFETGLLSEWSTWTP